MTLAAQDYHYIVNLLEQETAIQLGDEKHYFVEARLTPLARQYFNNDLAGLIEALKNGQTTAAFRQYVLEALAINETYFFRDPAVFELLRTHILPDLIERRQAEKTLSVWWPACSSGEDPYSFCMLLHEHFPALLEWEITLVASDFSHWVLDVAKAGRYSLAQVNRGLSARQLMHFFEQDGLSWVLKDTVRKMVRFREINLVKRWPALSGFDLVALRNVMIYYDDKTRATLLARVAEVMRSDGFLLLGATESVGRHAGFETAFDGPYRPCYRRQNSESSPSGWPATSMRARPVQGDPL